MKTAFKIITALAVLATSLKAQNVRTELTQQFVVEGDTIHATLLSKGKSINKFHKIPVVLIIPGSGPTDRDGNSSILPGSNDSYKLLADSLLSHGIASFRYDKMGVGSSKTSKTEGELRFEDNTDVAVAALKKIKNLGFKDIYILGHSEGSLIGMLAAQQIKTDGFISVAGAGTNGYDLIKNQLQNNLPEPYLTPTLQKMDSIKQGYTVTQYNPMLASLLRQSVQPYLHSYFQYTPTEEIQKLEIPVLIIQGGRDLQTPEPEGLLLKEAKPHAEYLFYPKMNHVLKMVDESPEQNKASYYDADFPLQQNLARDISTWIQNL